MPFDRSHAALNRALRDALLPVAFLIAAPAVAQDVGYPTHPITVVVPFPAGGPTDASARLFAQAMSGPLHQAVVIENRPGAGGTLGSALVARAPADGYTLLWGGTSTLAVAPGLYRNVAYNAKSFVPVGMALRGPLMLAGRASLEAKSTAELLALAKTRPLTVGTAGNGSIGHLATEYLVETTKVPFTHVPYKGGAPALNDTIGGQVDLIFDNASQLWPQVKAGKLRAYFVTGSAPYAPAPDVPLAKSVLHADFEGYSWFGLVAPAATPAPVLKKLVDAMATAAATPEVRKNLADTGLEPGLPTPKQFADVIDADYRKWSAVIERNHVQPD